jgi:hypothetical protein
MLALEWNKKENRVAKLKNLDEWECLLIEKSIRKTIL